MAPATDRDKTRPLRCAAALLTLLGFLSALGCSSKYAVVKVAQAEIQPITRTVSTNGKVELTQDFQAHASGPGQVRQVFVKVGDQVKAGQILVRLEDSDARMRVSNAGFALAAAQNAFSNLHAGGSADELLTAKTDMTTAQITLQQAKSRLGTLQQLQSAGQASANEVSSAQTQVTEAENRVNALQVRQTSRFSSGDLSLQQNQIARSRAELAAAQNDLSNMDIHAPFAGTVYSVPVAPYAAITSGEDLVNVADLTRVQIRAFFDEPEIGRLAIGQPVRIEWGARPDHPWHGHISQTPTSITNYGTRSVGECLVTVDDARGDLIPNINVTLFVTTLHKDRVLVIPHESLRTNANETFVYKIVDGTLRKTPVKVGVVTQTSAEIVSGLEPGDTIMRVPMNDGDLKDGMQVKVQP